MLLQQKKTKKTRGGIDMTISGLTNLIASGLIGDLPDNADYKYESPNYDESLKEILTDAHKKRITEKVKTEVIKRKFLPSRPSENNEPLPPLPLYTSTRKPISPHIENITVSRRKALTGEEDPLLNTQSEGGRDNFKQKQLNKFKSRAKKNSKKIKKKNKNKYHHISDH